MSRRAIAAKRLDPAAAAARIAAWRAAGEEVALARCSFDLLTAAAARALAAARGSAARLVAAVPDDAALAAERGEPPLLAAEHRATLAAALRAVDAVVVFDAGSWAGLAAALMADRTVGDGGSAAERALVDGWRARHGRG